MTFEDKKQQMKEKRIGESYTNPSGYHYIIVDYIDCHNVSVQFDNGEISTKLDYDNVKKGRVALSSLAHERHGERYSKLWKEWNTMRWRCNPKNKRHHVWYSDNGIGVCEEWSVYTNFKDWALSNGFSEDLTIDRIDSTKDYSPSNCQWITLSENISKAHKGRSKKK